MAVELRPPRRILAMKLRSLGDTVLMTASLDILHRTFPDTPIDVLVTAKWSSILKGIPGIENIYEYERRGHAASRAKTIARWAITLRRNRYDWVLGFHASPSSALLSFATGAGTRANHFHGHRDSNRYSTVEIPGKGTVKPIIERDLDVLRGLGIEIESRTMPKLCFERDELTRAQSFLLQQGLKAPWAAIGLGASRPTKVWPLDRFAEVALELVMRRGLHVVVIAGPGENALRDAFMDRLRERAQAQGVDPRFLSRVQAPEFSNIRLLGATLSLCNIFVGNDSGPKHMAVASGTPTVTMIGPEDPFEWHPYSQEEHPYLNVPNLACRKDALPGYPAWCGLDICTVEQHKCMKQLDVRQVLERVEQVEKKRVFV